MGEYAPEDQRTIHNNAGPDQSMSNWQSREKTERERQFEQQQEQDDRMGGQPGDQQQALDAQIGGPRPEYDQYELNQAGNINSQAEAQSGYGNSREENGQMEQDVATGSYGEQPLAQDDSVVSDAQPGEISDRPDVRAAADANRPLSGS